MQLVAVVSRTGEGLNLALDLARLQDVIWVNPAVMASDSEFDAVMAGSRHTDLDHTTMLRALRPDHLTDIGLVIPVLDVAYNAPTAECVKMIHERSGTGAVPVITLDSRSLHDPRAFGTIVEQILGEHRAACL